MVWRIIRWSSVGRFFPSGKIYPAIWFAPAKFAGQKPPGAFSDRHHFPPFIKTLTCGCRRAVLMARRLPLSGWAKSP